MLQLHCQASPLAEHAWRGLHHACRKASLGQTLRSWTSSRSALSSRAWLIWDTSSACPSRLLASCSKLPWGASPDVSCLHYSHSVQ